MSHPLRFAINPIQNPQSKTAYTAEGLPMKFTLRDLFWLVLVVGLALGWWLDRRCPYYIIEGIDYKPPGPVCPLPEH